MDPHTKSDETANYVVSNRKKQYCVVTWQKPGYYLGLGDMIESVCGVRNLDWQMRINGTVRGISVRVRRARGWSPASHRHDNEGSRLQTGSVCYRRVTPKVPIY